MIDAILTLGDSARLRQDLIKGKQSVIQYEANLGWPFCKRDGLSRPGGLRDVPAVQAEFHGRADVAQVQEEIAKLQNQPIEARELDRIKTQLRAARIRELQTSMAGPRRWRSTPLPTESRS